MRPMVAETLTWNLHPPHCSHVIKNRRCPSLLYYNQRRKRILVVGLTLKVWSPLLPVGLTDIVKLASFFYRTWGPRPTISSHLEVIRVCKSIDIDSDLINAAKSECDGLDLNTKTSFKAFPPGENYMKIIESVKQ